MPMCLESLAFFRIDLVLQDFKTILDATVHLQNLNVHSLGFGADHRHLLRFEYPHYLTQLKTLKIRERTGLSVEIVQQILSEMPNLEVLEAPPYQGPESTGGQPTLDLFGTEVFDPVLFLDDAIGSEEESRVVLAQLAKMEKLEGLALRGGPHSGLNGILGHHAMATRENALELSLNRGMESLGSLSGLTRLSWTGNTRVTPWTEAEAE